MTSATLKAEVYFLTAEDGGRRTPPNPGYRGHVDIDGVQTSFEFVPIEKEHFQLGEAQLSHVRPLFPEHVLLASLFGRRLKICEGDKTVGFLTVQPQMPVRSMVS